MANITASTVNELRKRTGVGMMDCKKALVECDGDIDKAIDHLREKGQKLASKRADREASEGCVLASTTENKTFGALIIINCETDFVAKNDDFIDFTRLILDKAIEAKVKNIEEVKTLVINGSTVENLIIEQIAKIGEKIEISKYETVSGPALYSYIHTGNRLATIIVLNKTGFDTYGHDVAMQTAAMAPIALDKSAVSDETIEREMEVYRGQIREEGKPENMIDKIAQGKLNKFFKDSTLISQDFIKNPKTSVLQYLQEGDKELIVTEFKRFVLEA